jgi:ectoine hydroxylase-related dioxygenase (phytanoyl-CoA dioxygenase family)
VDVARKLRTHGVVVIEDVLPAETMDQIVSDLANASGTFHGGINSFAGHHTVRNAAKPLGESSAAQQLAVEPLVLGAVEAALRPWCKKVLLGTCSAIAVEPPPTVEEAPAPPQVLHRDDSMWGASSWKWLPQTPAQGRPEFSVSVMWALSDFSVRNGATRALQRGSEASGSNKRVDECVRERWCAGFLPGSHTWRRDDEGGYGSDGPQLPAGIEDGRDAIQAVMRKGSVVLWSGGTLHGASSHAPRSAQGETDDTSSVRRGLLFIYNLGYLRTEHNFHWAMPHAVLTSFGPRLADLVGLTGENAVEHPWYSGPVCTYRRTAFEPPFACTVSDGLRPASRQTRNPIWAAATAVWPRMASSFDMYTCLGRRARH